MIIIFCFAWIINCHVNSSPSGINLRSLRRRRMKFFDYFFLLTLFLSGRWVTEVCRLWKHWLKWFPPPFGSSSSTHTSNLNLILLLCIVLWVARFNGWILAFFTGGMHLATVWILEKLYLRDFGPVKWGYFADFL